METFVRHEMKPVKAGRSNLSLIRAFCLNKLKSRQSQKTLRGNRKSETNVLVPHLKGGAPKGGLEGWGREGWGGPEISRFFFPATIFILSSALGGPLIEFWLKCARLGSLVVV